MNSTDTDRIAEKILLRAPRTRIWHALADSEEFGMNMLPGKPPSERYAAYRKAA